MAIAVNASDGSMYVIENNANKIRLVTAAGVTTTVAGNGTAGFQDGQGSNALFSSPLALAVLGNLVYICDGGNNVIRAMTRDGVVTTVYGSGVSGYANGFGTSAQFTGGGVKIGGIAADPNTGNLYVADSGANIIRLIQPNGNVSLYAGGGNGLSGGFNNSAVATSAIFNRPTGVAVDSNGTLWVADYSNQRIRGVLANGTVFTLAGSAPCNVLTPQYNALGYSPASGYYGTGACFLNPTNIAVDNLGNVFVTNTPGDSSINVFPPQVISVSTGLVQTLIGCPTGTLYPGTSVLGTGCNGYLDGPGSSAAFGYVTGVACDASGNLLLLDSGNGMIRKVTMSSPGVPANTSTVAGALYVDPNQVMMAGSSGTAGSGLIAFDFINSWTYYTGSINTNALLRVSLVSSLPQATVPFVVGGGFSGRVSSGTNGFTPASNTSVSFNGINGVAFDAARNWVYISTGGAQVITMNAATGSCARFVGNNNPGNVDGALYRRSTAIACTHCARNPRLWLLREVQNAWRSCVRL